MAPTDSIDLFSLVVDHRGKVTLDVSKTYNVSAVRTTHTVREREFDQCRANTNRLRLHGELAVGLPTTLYLTHIKSTH